MEIFFEYLRAAFIKWWWLVTILLFGLDKAAEWFWPSYRAWLERTFSPQIRRRLFWGTVSVFVFIAGFLAWKDEHEVRLKLQETSQKELTKAHQENATLKGQIQARSESELEKKLQAQEAIIVQLRYQLEPRIITSEQRGRMIEALEKIPSGKTRKLRFEVLFGCNECRVFASDIIKVWKGSPGWEIKSTNSLGLNPRLGGLAVGTDPAQCPAVEAQVILDVLRAGGIYYQTVSINDELRKELAIPDGFCPAFVGGKPPA